MYKGGKDLGRGGEVKKSIIQTYWKKYLNKNHVFLKYGSNKGDF